MKNIESQTCAPGSALGAIVDDAARIRGATIIPNALLGAASVCVLASAGLAATNGYTKVDLVTDRTDITNHQDTRLVNPWGLAFAPNGLLYVADNGTGLGTIYPPSGIPIPFSIQVPSPASASATSAPTGLVFNSTQGFRILHAGQPVPATFLFASEDGAIAGWSAVDADSHAVLTTDRSVVNAVYKGLALGGTESAHRLYATDFHNGNVDMLDESFVLVNSPGAFLDPGLPASYAPFGIAEINGAIFVSYAKQEAPENKDDEPGPGHGFIDAFRADGTFLRRIVSGGELNSPWGLARAPSGFGPASGALLVGNFGDGRILAYNMNGDFLGALRDSTGKTIAIDGLWSLAFLPDIANDGVIGERRLYFTAGRDHESHGLMGYLRPNGPLE